MFPLDGAAWWYKDSTAAREYEAKSYRERGIVVSKGEDIKADGAWLHNTEWRGLMTQLTEKTPTYVVMKLNAGGGKIGGTLSMYYGQTSARGPHTDYSVAVTRFDVNNRTIDFIANSPAIRWEFKGRFQDAFSIIRGGYYIRERRYGIFELQRRYTSRGVMNDSFRAKQDPGGIIITPYPQEQYSLPQWYHTEMTMRELFEASAHDPHRMQP